MYPRNPVSRLFGGRRSATVSIVRGESHKYRTERRSLCFRSRQEGGELRRVIVKSVGGLRVRLSRWIPLIPFQRIPSQ